MMRIFKISMDYVNNWLMNEAHNRMFYSKCLKNGLYSLHSVMKLQSTGNYILFCLSTFSGQIFYLVIGAVLYMHSG